MSNQNLTTENGICITSKVLNPDGSMTVKNFHNGQEVGKYSIGKPLTKEDEKEFRQIRTEIQNALGR